MVTLVRCKLCNKHKASVLLNPLCKGSAKAAVEAYIEGTSFVKELSIDRHLRLINYMYFPLTTKLQAFKYLNIRMPIFE